MAEIFLVVLDASGRTNFKALTQQFQNFYFVFANDEAKAKEMVLYSFMRSQRRPSDQLINEIQAALKATRLSAMLRNMNEKNNFWTYIPFGRRPGAGQQAVVPDPSKLVRPGDPQDPEATSARNYVPEAPASGVEVTEADLRGVQFSGADGTVLNKFRKPQDQVAQIPEEGPMMTPEQENMVKSMADQNKLLMQQNQAMMEQMTKMVSMVNAAQAPAPKSRRKAAAPPVDPPAPV